MRVQELGPWPGFDLRSGKWCVLYDAWKPEDFALCAAAGIDPKSVVFTNGTKRYQDVIRRGDLMVLRIYR